MSKYVVIMGMKFIKGKEKDFGSIRMTEVKSNDVRNYVLLSRDKAKLIEITNCAGGSLAYCTDTKELLMYNDTNKKWYEV